MYDFQQIVLEEDFQLFQLIAMFQVLTDHSGALALSAKVEAPSVSTGLTPYSEET
jgi:hypothetical protein